MNTYIFSEDEKKLRKRWFLFLWLILVIFSLWNCVYSIHVAQTYNVPINLLLNTLAGLITGSFINFLLYLFAYRKPGTRLLGFLVYMGIFSAIVIGVITIISCIVSADVRLLISSLYLTPPINALLFIAFWAVTIYYYHLGLKMLRLNKKIKNLTNMSAASEKPSLDELKNAANLEELDRKLNELITKWPQFEPLIYDAYKTKKKELS
jgi:hypothetical protein